MDATMTFLASRMIWLCKAVWERCVETKEKGEWKLSEVVKGQFKEWFLMPPDSIPNLPDGVTIDHNEVTITDGTNRWCFLLEYVFSMTESLRSVSPCPMLSKARFGRDDNGLYANYPEPKASEKLKVPRSLKERLGSSQSSGAGGTKESEKSEKSSNFRTQNSKPNKTMATKTIDHMDFYVAIKPYKTEDNGDQTFDSLRVSVGYNKGRGFYVSYHPGWGDGSMWGCVFDFSKNPLTAGGFIGVEPATKNNSKRIEQMHSNLEIAKLDIAWLFNERKFEQMQQLMKDVALYGYTASIEERMKGYKNVATVKAQVEAGTNTPTNQTNENETPNNNQNNSNTMEANNMKAADLIGKTIIVGENIATITIKSVDRETLQGEFKKAGATIGMPLPITMENLNQQIASGAWRIDGEGAAPKAQPTEKEAQKPRVQPKPAQEIEEEEPTEQPAEDSPTEEEKMVNGQSSMVNDEDPFVAAYQAQKAVKPEHIVLFKYKDFFCAIMDDAQPVADACGTKPAMNNGYAFVLFKAEELPTVMPKLIRQGKQVNVVESPSPDGEVKSEKGKVKNGQWSMVNGQSSMANGQSSMSNGQSSMVNGQSSMVNGQSSMVNDKKPKPSDCTAEPEAGKPRIIDYGKSIVVAGDTTKIEAVLLTLWGRKRPYTHKGKTYSGIQLSAKHKATVKEIIKLAS